MPKFADLYDFVIKYLFAKYGEGVLYVPQREISYAVMKRFNMKREYAHAYVHQVLRRLERHGLVIILKELGKGNIVTLNQNYVSYYAPYKHNLLEEVLKEQGVGINEDIQR